MKCFYKYKIYFIALVSCLLNNLAFACNKYTQWWCETINGIVTAKEQGKNGVILSGYAYHTSVAAHWPSGSAEHTPADPQGLNEVPYGIGYSRSCFNKESNEEYILFGVVFSDSYWKPELHIGYTYLQYHDLFDTENLKLGLGYTPMLLIKPSWTNDAPIILPGAGLSSSIRYKDFELMATWANVIFFNIKWDFS